MHGTQWNGEERRVLDNEVGIVREVLYEDGLVLDWDDLDVGS